MGTSDRVLMSGEEFGDADVEFVGDVDELVRRYAALHQLVQRRLSAVAYSAGQFAHADAPLAAQFLDAIVGIHLLIVLFTFSPAKIQTFSYYPSKKQCFFLFCAKV